MHKADAEHHPSIKWLKATSNVQESTTHSTPIPKLTLLPIFKIKIYLLIKIYPIIFFLKPLNLRKSQNEVPISLMFEPFRTKIRISLLLGNRKMREKEGYP